MKITEDKEHRDYLFEKLTEERFKGGFPHQHELWPCVLKGAGERWLRARGHVFRPSRRQVLYFVRGESGEALIVHLEHPDIKPAFVRHGVIIRPDWWTASLGTGSRHPMDFYEIKTTALSSQNFWKLLQVGDLDILRRDFISKSYFDQTAIYCVATGVKECGLIVYFLHGDYADRRKNCPNETCDGMLGQEMVDNIFRVCTKCGYKSYAIDMRSYRLQFTDEELAWYEQEVFYVRRDQFLVAQEAKTEAGVRKAAEATPNFMCKDCVVGQAIKCPSFGSKQ